MKKLQKFKMTDTEKRKKNTLSNKKSKITTVLKIFALILIIALSINIGAYAAYVLSATDVSYTKSDGTTISVKEALDELHNIQPLGKAVSVGDYVAYNSGTYSYTSPIGTGSSHGNGNSNQTFTSSSSLKWRVLGWDDETGGVMLISEDPIGNFTMKGSIGYLYAEQELNEICKYMDMEQEQILEKNFYMKQEIL